MNVPTSGVERAQMTQAVNRVVNHVFYGALMREFRASNPMPLMGGGSAGSAFLQQLDQIFLDRMAADKESPLTRAILKQLGQEHSDSSASLGPAASWEGSSHG